MRYEEFVQKTRGLPFFGKEVLKGPAALQFHRWMKTGRIIHLKRGLYTLPGEQRKISFSSPWLANTLYSPSYLSLEFALSWYDLIPERATTFTSVSRLKTATFTNPLGRFVYRHLKKELFFGFTPIQDEFKRDILMAQPEKALLDLLYLSGGWQPSEQFFRESLRLQQLDQLNAARLKRYAQTFAIKKITAAIPILMGMKKYERHHS